MVDEVSGGDRIVVVDASGIAEQGRHDDLIVEQGTYRRLHEAQVRRGGPRLIDSRHISAIAFAPTVPLGDQKGTRCGSSGPMPRQPPLL